MQEAVSMKVPDAQRAARLNKSILGLRQEMLADQAVGNKFQSDFLALNSRRTVARAELETLIEQDHQQRVALTRRILELHSQMIQATTTEEWKELFPYERAVLTD
jgi:hypothetical protein